MSRLKEWIAAMRALTGPRLALYDDALLRGGLSQKELLAAPEAAAWLIRHHLLSPYGDTRWGTRKLDNARVLFEQHGYAAVSLPGCSMAVPESNGLRPEESHAAHPDAAPVHSHQVELFAMEGYKQ